MKTTFIYGLEDPRDGKMKYVGKSNNPKKRLREHLSESKRKFGKGTKKENWINKLYKNNLIPTLKILDEVDMNNYEYWEEYYISQYKELLNYDKKGVGMIRDMDSLSALSVKKTSKKVYQYSIEGSFLKEFKSTRDVEMLLGINHSSVSRCCRGEFKHSGGFIFSYEKKDYVKKVINPNSLKKKVQEIDSKGNLIAEYLSIAEASCSTLAHHSNISKVCNGKLKKTKGKYFIFKQ